MSYRIGEENNKLRQFSSESPKLVTADTTGRSHIERILSDQKPKQRRKLRKTRRKERKWSLKAWEKGFEMA